MSIGDQAKVYLPGESPYVEVVEETGSMMKGRILNKLFTQYSAEDQAEFTGREFGTAEPLPRLHDFKQGDELWFEKGDYGEWVPVADQTSATSQ